MVGWFVIVLDTNILAYAIGRDHPLREPCRRLVEEIGSRGVSASTTPDVIQEFVYLRSHRFSRRDAASFGRWYADLLTPLLVVDEQALAAGLALYGKSKRIGPIEAILAAPTLAAEAEAIVSADVGFDEIRGLKRWDPSGREVERLLAGR